MHAFLCVDRKPVTIQAHSHLNFENDIKAALRRYWPKVELSNGIFYGVVYYFHKVPNQIDADNLSKPIFEALKAELYADDKFIRIVRSGVFDLRTNSVDVLDLTHMPANVFTDFITALDKSDHILYIEVGNLDYGMFEFGHEH